MSVVIGLCGYAGVGKSTAIDIMKGRCEGVSVYLGEVVLDEVRRRGLPETPESEKTIRLELRAADNAALAKAKAEEIVARLDSGRPVMIDAVMVVDEFDFLRSFVGVGRFHLLEVEAPFEGRCERLLARPGRPLTREQILTRDRTEREKLGIEKVFASATRRVVNDGSIAAFEHNLARFLAEILPGSGG